MVSEDKQKRGSEVTTRFRKVRCFRLCVEVSRESDSNESFEIRRIDLESRKDRVEVCRAQMIFRQFSEDIAEVRGYG